MGQIDEIKIPVKDEMQAFEPKFRQFMASNVALLDRITYYIIKRKGKQLRPMLVFLCAKIHGDISESTHRGAALVELMHTATLVHDDVVDDSLERAALDEKYFHQKYSIPSENLVFIYLGILGPGRGIENILEAFSSDKVQSHVVFMGFGEFENRIIQRSKVNSNIHFHPAVKHDEVVSYTQHADVGLCLIEKISLSDYYCLPNKLFEYGFSEIPVLASNFPDILETVESYNLGKCSDLEFSSIYKAIQDFELMNELPQMNAEKLYPLSWEAQEKKLIELYKKVLRRKV